MSRLRALVFARPLLSFITLCAVCGETLNLVLILLPPDHNHLLPWIVRALTLAGGIAGARLLRGACVRSAANTVRRIRMRVQQDCVVTD